MKEELLDVGPNKADAIRNYENMGKKIFYENSFWKKILNKALNANTSNLFIGRRGSGKTMLLKESIARISDKMRNLVKRDNLNKFILPVDISFTAFIHKYSFPSIGDFHKDEKEIMKELFRGYFYLMTIQNVLEAIKKLNLKPINEEMSLYDIEFSLEKNNYYGLEIIKNLIKELRFKVIPRKIIEEKTKKNEFGINKILTLKHGKGRDKIERKFEFAKAPQYPYFEYALENI
ncbi:MAG: hypothetical protein GF311_27585, partial [Candidatus Lokiarchaeota archaeon]|nr:hypothetical protein [Candidatus Lokiarchaeota archaeon]